MHCISTAPQVTQELLSTLENPSAWEYNFYWPFYPTGNLATFQLTSPTVKAEYEHRFLRSHAFAYECPAAYHEFMAQLTAEQRGWIRRLRIEVFSWKPTMNVDLGCRMMRLMRAG